MSVATLILIVRTEKRNEMRIKLTPSESQKNPCDLCGRPANFLKIMKIAGNKFLCNRCVR